MREQVIALLKQVRQHFPYTPPGELYPSGQAHEFLWNIALREGREQVIRWIAEEAGVEIPNPDPVEDYVYSPEDRGTADAHASPGIGPGSEYP